MRRTLLYRASHGRRRRSSCHEASRNPGPRSPAQSPLDLDWAAVGDVADSRLTPRPDRRLGASQQPPGSFTPRCQFQLPCAETCAFPCRESVTPVTIRVAGVLRTPEAFHEKEDAFWGDQLKRPGWETTRGVLFFRPSPHSEPEPSSRTGPVPSSTFTHWLEVKWPPLRLQGSAVCVVFMVVTRATSDPPFRNDYLGEPCGMSVR